MIRNLSKGAVVADSFERCITWWEQSCGLMFRDVSPLLFIFDRPKIVRLHSWFVREPLDLIFVNEYWRVVECFSGFPVNSSYVSICEACFLIELPVGCIVRSGTCVGDVLSCDTFI